MNWTRSALPITALVAAATLWGGDAQALTGGPDANGWYTFQDQAEAGVTYNYIDISATGTMVTSGNSGTAPITLSAPITVYGHTLNTIVANSNGFLTSDMASSGDISNDCGLPSNPSTGEGLRIYALHDDLTTTVYTQFFTAAQAATAGFAQATAGMTVVQWVGVHDAGSGAVDFEAILFHHNNDVLVQVAVDADGGSTSTTGMQDELFQTGIEYSCNSAGSIVGGTTAVLFELEPTSDCCTAAGVGETGCQKIACQTAICAVDPFCCNNTWDQICADQTPTICPYLCGTGTGVTLNEIRIDQPGGDVDEYVEIAGPPGTSLDGLSYIVLGDIPTGELEEVTDLTGEVIPASGFFVIAEAGFTLGTADLVTPLTMDNTDTNTHMLVANLSTALFNNLDSDANGVLDSDPWDAVVDTVANIDPAEMTILPYGPTNPTMGPPQCVASPVCQEVNDGIDAAFAIKRCPDNNGTWVVSDDDPAAGQDSPGAANICAVCGNGIVEFGEDCDGDGMGMGGETAACDIDCTNVACGDGVTNMTAGEMCDDANADNTDACLDTCMNASCGDGFTQAGVEDCDDMGESATCDVDCTTATCGDGTFNMTAGEMCDDGNADNTDACLDTCMLGTCGDGFVQVGVEDCDDMGESATCNMDCTTASCGDGVTNMTAGEDCDDMGESATCNTDCSAASCGDGQINMTAGETCDDMGETATCNSDCTMASCGDGVVNMTAGEACDDGAESATCNADCSAATCGDGIVNAAAGEECDDGNTTDGDGCAANCVNETSGVGGGGVGGGGVGGGGTGGDGGDSSGGTSEDGGCGCATVGQQRDDSSAWALASLLGLGLVVSRRRRRSA